jgi:hypothetical protein
MQFGSFRSIIAVGLVATVMMVFYGSASYADNPFARTLSFNDGSQIVAFDWFDDYNILLYTVNPHGSILWKHNISDGTRSKIISATQLSEILPTGADISKLRLSVSPSHNYLLFYEPYTNPNQKPFFEVIRINGQQPELVKFANLPEDFWINAFAWDPTDQYLYVSAVPYLFPGEPTSIGRMSLNTNSFVALTVKDNADLVDEIVYSSKLDSLIINCWSFRGEYPKERYILKYDFYLNKIEILGLFPYVHDVHITASGEDIFFSVASKDTNNDGYLDWLDESDISTFNLEKKENQILMRYAGYETMPIVTNDRKWMGYLRIPERIGRRPKPDDPKQLWIMNLAERREIFITENCEGYLFSRDSKKILALSSDRMQVEVFELPTY